MTDNLYYEKRAEELRQTLFCRELTEFDIIKYKKNSDGTYEVTERLPKENLESIVMERGTEIVLDFKGHNVGYFEISTNHLSGIPDSPVYLKFVFAQRLFQLDSDAQHYTGGLSGAWIQEEYVHSDVTPGKIILDRRYAFRYVKITSLAVAKSFNYSLTNPVFTTVTSADESNLDKFETEDKDFALIDKISLTTLRDCMQEVFEDSPMRDRRLWVGDLYLEALVDYITYKNFDVVKRCLCLFAANRLENGAVPACISDNAGIKCYNGYLVDYALLFCVSLYDFYKASNDIEFVREIWQVAVDQIEIIMKRVDADGVIIDKPDEWWSFIDWHSDLNKQAPTQGILIFALKNMIDLARTVEDMESLNRFEKYLAKTVQGALEKLYDSEKGLFLSGDIKQPSKAAQIWMIIADILPKEDNIKLFGKIKSDETVCDMSTPYLVHYYLHASYILGLYDKTKKIILDYWGGMVKEGADTFWEAYRKGEPDFSPYGSTDVNSYCHAWACTPSLYIRKLYEDNKYHL